MKKKCDSQKRNGQRCGADAQAGKTLCVFHDPAKAAAGRRARRLGGINRSRGNTILPLETPDNPLCNTQDVSVFSPECICFPENEQPFFGLPIEEQIAAKVLCPLHGDRFAPTFHIYVPKWRRDNEKKIRWFRLSPQYHKAWHASFPPD